MSLSVLKFGGSVLRSDGCLPVAVQEIYAELRTGARVVAVVSAFRGSTDELLDRVKPWRPDGDGATVAMLLATAEQRAAILLGLALERSGIQTKVLDPKHLAVRTTGATMDATPISVDVANLRKQLDKHEVVVVPGFVGVGVDGDVTLLGRGGSDMTAIFLAAQMGADYCGLIKDVPALFESNPLTVARPRWYRTLTWQDALAVDAEALQVKATQFACNHRVRFELGRFGEPVRTIVGTKETVCESPQPPILPMRVGFLGLGTVNFGVYRGLEPHADRFRPVLAAVLDPSKHLGDDLPQGFVTSDPHDVVAQKNDIVIEAIGGRVPTADLVRNALRSGAHVVTANKELIAHDGVELHALAAEFGVSFRYSAAVGGGVPMIETIVRAAAYGPVQKIEGVLNGTTNFVLDRLIDGDTFDDAVLAAQEAGFAEADPTLDVCGHDAAFKLVILARKGFGARVAVDDIDCQGIVGLDPQWVEDARASGRRIRLVATCERTATGVQATVRPVVLPADHPLAMIRNEENRLLVTDHAGQTTMCSGKGAGRWPTAEAVIADVFDVYREARGAVVERRRHPRGPRAAEKFDATMRRQPAGGAR